MCGLARSGVLSSLLFLPQVVGVEEGHEFPLGDRVVRVLHLPGHSPGSLVRGAGGQEHRAAGAPRP